MVASILDQLAATHNIKIPKREPEAPVVHAHNAISANARFTEGSVHNGNANAERSVHGARANRFSENSVHNGGANRAPTPV